MADKSLLAVLKLDSKQFKSGLSDTEKDILKFSAAATAAGAAVLAAAKFTANYQEEMIQASRAAGIGSETFSKYSHAADLSGISTEQLTKSFVKLNNLTPQMTKEIESFGVAVTDNQGNLKSSEQLMSDIADRMQNMKSPADQAALAVAAFGEKGASMVNLLSGGSEALREAAAEAEKFGLVVTERAGQNAEKFNDDIDRVGMSLSGLRNSIGESIIEFINQSNAMQTVSDTIAALTGLWRGLNDDTKNFIITMGLAVSGAAAVAAALVGIEAAAPAVTAALAGISAPVAAMVAGGIAIAALGATTIQYWDQIKSAVAPLKSLITDIFSPWVSYIKDTFNWFGQLKDKISGSTEDISILGTVAKTILSVISAGVYLVITPFQVLINLVSNLTEGIYNVAVAAKSTLSGDFEAAIQSSLKATENFKQATIGSADIIRQNYGKVKDLFGKDLIVEIQKSKDAVTGLGQATDIVNNRTAAYVPVVANLTTQMNKMQESFAAVDAKQTDFSQSVSTTASVIESITKLAGQFVAELNKIANVIANQIQRAAQIAARDIDKMLIDLQKNYDKQVADYKSSEEAKIQALSASYDEQINTIKNQEKYKNALIEAASKERLFLLDAEYQAAKAKKEKEYQDYIAAETAKFEADKALILQNTADKEQAQLVESLMNADFQAWLQSQAQLHNQSMVDFANQYASDQTAINNQMNSDIEANTSATNQTVQDLEQQKNDSITAANQLMSDMLNTLGAQLNADQEALQKEKLQTQYDADVAAWESTKNMKVAEIIINGIAAAFGIIAAMAPIAPPIGLIIGATLAAAMGVTTAIAANDVATSPGPVKPAGLLEDGGFIAGNITHAQGGINAEIESKEFMIDKNRTSQITDAIDNNLLGGEKSLNITFGPGSIVGSNMDSEETAYKMSQLLADLLRRQGIA